MLQVQELGYRYAAKPVLDALSFSIASEEIVGLLGPNGAGKSTLFRLLCGVYAMQEGSIIFEGQQVASPGKLMGAKLRQKMGVVFQEASVDDKLSALQNLRLSGELFGVPKAELEPRVQKGLEDLGLAERANDKLKTFSGGMRRRLELLRSMLHQPTFMLMDEPSSGLDEEGFRRFWHLCEQLRNDSKASILLATHRSEEAQKCDRLLVLHQGKMIANDTPKNLCARVSGDRVTLKLAENCDVNTSATWLQSLQQNFASLNFVLEADEIKVVVEHGHALIPRFIESLPKLAVQSVYARKPTLADAYLQMTGALL